MVETVSVPQQSVHRLLFAAIRRKSVVEFRHQVQGVYLNAGYDKKQSDELTKIIYDDDWSFRYEPKEITEWRHTLCIERLPLIECGFIS